ncbi:DUF3769 domain-containing protein [Prochlorococcus marinus]|uniref:DUF3769 domain-containing protein n=1 Tax=Prochlorococcus marinus TaxID=1219 RepID=UPI0039B0D7B9
MLGFTTFASFFEIAIGKDNLVENLYVDTSKSSLIDKLKLEQKENIFLTLNIFADKQYDYDQDIYLAQGNVKALVNGWILRSDILSYQKSTGILSAEGNIRLSKGGQYLRGKEFKYNLLKKEGVIEEAYGILDIKNVLDDFKIDTISNKIIYEKRSKKKEKNTYTDGIEFSFGNVELPKNKITRSDKSIGSINNWRFKSDLININKDGWESSRINFTNDPFDPHQIAFEGIDVIAEEDDEGKLIITSSKTNLILENRTKIFIGKRIFKDKKKKRKFGLILDSKDRDGLVLIRRSDKTNINNNLELELQPQFLISRSLLGKTYSYNSEKSKEGKVVDLSDVFGLNIKVNAIYKEWNFDSKNDLSTLNTKRLFNGLRHSSSLRRYFKIPILDDTSFNVFTTYRSRAWNGTIGETEIKSAYGGFVQKTYSFEALEGQQNLNIRFGTAKYEAEKLKNTKLISLWRSSFFASLDSEYQIWNSNRKKRYQKSDILFSPILINPELVIRTNVNTAFFKYEDGSDQGFLKISFGPEIRLGRLERKLFDYTKLFVMPGFKIKVGNSPFKFDNAIDLKTLNIGFMQQIYGPIMFDITSNLNIDNSSENYGEYYDTKLGLLCHKRAYEFGLYYQPNNDAGGIYFRLNGFEFGNSVTPVF